MFLSQTIYREIRESDIRMKGPGYPPQHLGISDFFKQPGGASEIRINPNYSKISTFFTFFWFKILEESTDSIGWFQEVLSRK